MSINQPADQCVKQDDKYSPQGGQEEERLSSVRHPASSEIEATPNGIKSEKSCQTHGSIKLAVFEVFQRVNDDPVSSSSGVEKSADTHHRRNLTSGNVNGRTGHERRDGGQRNEIDNPAAANKADKADDRACNDRKRRGNHVTRDTWVRLCDDCNNIARDGRCNRNRLYAGQFLLRARSSLAHSLRW